MTILTEGGMWIDVPKPFRCTKCNLRLGYMVWILEATADLPRCSDGTFEHDCQGTEVDHSWKGLRFVDQDVPWHDPRGLNLSKQDPIADLLAWRDRYLEETS